MPESGGGRSTSEPQGGASMPEPGGRPSTSDPVTIAYFYRVRWGAIDEFIDLFARNHWPILREQLATGRFLDVSAATPRFHGDGRADWNFMVTITYRDWAAIEDHSEAEIAARLFPDQALYSAEERRRFELLEAHWDVPLEDHPLP
ncbi:MAG TPA: hypothetical protein VIM30_03070 [Candidatus Limnocylindrales bacterium]